jgi:hypothetical protein
MPTSYTTSWDLTWWRLTEGRSVGRKRSESARLSRGQPADPSPGGLPEPGCACTLENEMSSQTDCFLDTVPLGLRSEGRDAVRAAYEQQFFTSSGER